MLPFKLVYSDDYYLPIGSHVFPAEKYRRIHERLLAPSVATQSDFVAPARPLTETCCWCTLQRTWRNCRRGHSARAKSWSWKCPIRRSWCDAFWLAAGGSILAADHALNDGIGISIGGGFHHAFPDHGEGFCMIHDVAVAIRRMQRDDKNPHGHDGRLRRTPGQWDGRQFLPGTRMRSPEPPADVPLARHLDGPRILRPIEDCTAAMLDDVFTISLHQENNYPEFKPPSSLDMDLPDEIGDDEYLACLGNAHQLRIGQVATGTDLLPRREPILIAKISSADCR